MDGQKGFTLIEIVLVMAIIAITLALTGPRISAGINRLELNQAAQSIRRYTKLARVQAQRTEKEQYVILDRDKHSVAQLNESMQIVREEKLPGSVEILTQPEAPITAIYIAPSGFLRANPLRLRSRT